jgi:nucleoside-diphosphate-sugar epimerase
MKKIYAVIGGAGFIGHHIVNRLINAGNQVIVIDNLSTGKIENINPKAIFYKLDIAQDDLTDILKGVHVVFLTAAMARVQPSIQDPITYNKTNVEGTLRVLHACHKADVKRVIYSASSSAYGDTDIFPTPETTKTNPLSPYGLQKFIGEQYCRLYSQLYGLDTVSLRYFNVYGEGMPLEGAYRTVLSIFGEQYKNDMPLTYTNDGNQRRDFTYVQDVVTANILAAEYKHPLCGDVFNVGNGYNYSVNEVIEMFGVDSKFLEHRIEPKITLADNTKLRETFGWTPTGDLTKFIDQYKKLLK